MKRRVKFLSIFFILATLLLVSRLYFIAIKSHTYYEQLADENIIKSEFTTAPRGEITDLLGEPIAINKLGFSISLKAHLDSSKLQSCIEQIRNNFPDFNTTKLAHVYKKQNSAYNHKAIKIIDFIPYDDFISKFVKLNSNDFIYINPALKRFYPSGELTSHIIGYVAKPSKKELENSKVAKLTDTVGKTGIEKYYNTLLEGDLGEIKRKVTALNKTIKIVKEIKAKSKNLTLSIDLRLQKYIKQLFKGLTGVAIVMDSSDGAIISANSFPTYDNNLFVEGISKDKWKELISDLRHPFTNKFASGLYPPGSSIKPEVLLSFLNSKKIVVDEKLKCKGYIQLGNRKFRCWNHYGHGDVDAKRAIKESCDVYFYQGGLRVGIDKISTDLARYGLGKKTNIDLPNEFIGTLPSRNWKLLKYAQGWNKGDTLNTVIGQGNFLTTPLQIATQTALIATGKLLHPHFLKKIDDKNVTFASKDVLNSDEKAKLDAIRKGMYLVCNSKGGTAFKYNSAIIPIAGKTGTSQVVGIPQNEKKRMSEDELKYFKKSHAWFTSYGPYQNPKYVVTILIEHGGHGGKAAGEIASNIYNKLVELGYIPKSYIGR